MRFLWGKYYQMKKTKIVRLSDDKLKMLDFLKNLLELSENDVFKIALVKLYKEFKN